MKRKAQKEQSHARHDLQRTLRSLQRLPAGSAECVITHPSPQHDAHWLTHILTECRRVTKPSGPCFLIATGEQMVAGVRAIKKSGWRWQGIAPWPDDADFLIWGTSGPVSDFRPPVPPEATHLRHLVEACLVGGTILDPCGPGPVRDVAQSRGRTAINPSREP